jgi:hypothetical protein
VDHLEQQFQLFLEAETTVNRIGQLDIVFQSQQKQALTCLKCR